ncbi:MAG: hypothetical protein KGI06_01975 [Candidatus Micrarchaeota archaeon]|nr:hypothetical protein [Candidatus Micrarchaeota archaeon]
MNVTTKQKKTDEVSQQKAKAEQKRGAESEKVDPYVAERIQNRKIQKEVQTMLRRA